MPQVTGLDLAEEARRCRADIPIILCSGLTTSVNRQKARALGISRYLLKPYLISQMARNVREVLDGH